MHIDNALTLVKSHIEYQGYKLVSSREYYMNPVWKEVGYVKRSKPIIKLTSLLHEYGHIVQEISSLSDIDSKDRNKAFIVVQEYDAWARGKALAKELGIIPEVISEQEYDNEMAKYLVSYFEFVTFESRKNLRYLTNIYKTRTL